MKDRYSFWVYLHSPQLLQDSLFFQSHQSSIYWTKNESAAQPTENRGYFRCLMGAIMMEIMFSHKLFLVRKGR